MFNKDQEIILSNKQKVKVVRLLGQGGQGAVYEVESNGNKYALKWYLPEYLKQINQKAFYNNLADNYKAGKPSEDFLWPLAISEYKDNSFGYLMELRPKRFIGFNLLLNAKQRFSKFSTIIKAARNITKAFQELHRKGYSYQDINDGNFFVDVKTGDVLICDNDNVAPYGKWLGMIGKDRYMAPEVVMGQKHPDMETDLYSLSVVLFMMFFIAHPLEGEAVHKCPCLTTKFIRKLYAEKAVFVYDPNNDTNRPIRGIDNNVITFWNYYPETIKTMFSRAFTEGLYNASYRVRENEWIDCFDKMEDSLICCPKCGNEQFYNYTESNEQYIVCEDCGVKYNKPFVIQGKSFQIPIQKGNDIYGRQLHIENYDKIASVVESTKHPGLYGIKNLVDLEIHAKLPNGKEVTAINDQIIPLFDGTIINIENKEFEIKF